MPRRKGNTEAILFHLYLVHACVGDWRARSLLEGGPICVGATALKLRRKATARIRPEESAG